MQLHERDKEHFPYKELIDLELIELYATKSYMPISLPEQLNFVNVDRVRTYIRKSSHTGHDDDPVVLMSTMLETFFAHHSTTLLDLDKLVKMWSDLFVNWVARLEMQNILTVPFEQRGAPHDIDAYIVKARNPRFFRSKSDLQILVSRFTFNMARRFFIVPVHLERPHIQAYNKLREKIIERWYNIVTPKTVMSVNPQVVFVSLDPKSVAFGAFPPDAMYDVDTLKRKGNVFNKWAKREGAIRVAIAKETGYEDVVKQTELEWEEAINYANQLIGALIPRANAIDLETSTQMEGYEEAVDRILNEQTRFAELERGTEEEDPIDLSGSVYAKNVSDRVHGVMSGGIVATKTYMGQEYGFTKHAHTKAKERGISYANMMKVAHLGAHKGNNEYHYGKHAVVLDDNNTIITTYPVGQKEFAPRHVDVETLGTAFKKVPPNM